MREKITANNFKSIFHGKWWKNAKHFSWINLIRSLLRGRFIFILIIFIVAVSVYINTLSGDFIWDGTKEIRDNRQIRSFLNLKYAFTKDFSGMYRPLEIITYMVDYKISGLNPRGYHRTNILLHAFCSVLVFLLFLLVLHEKIPAFCLSLLFATHPIHTESVAWIAARDDILMSIFYSLALILVLIYLKKDMTKLLIKTSMIIAIVFCYLSALLSKEMAVTLPLIVFFIRYLSRVKNTKILQKKLMLINLILFVQTILYIVVRCVFLNVVIQEKPFLYLSGYLKIIMIAPRVFLGYYLSLFFFPVSLCANYSYPDVGGAEIVVYIFIFALITFLVIKLHKKIFFIFVGFTWMVITLLPAINIIPKAQLMSERYLYLPSVGFLLLLFGLYKQMIDLFRKRLNISSKNFIKATFCIFMIIFLAYSYKTIARNKCWKTEAILWAETVNHPLASTRAHYNLANIFKNAGYNEEALKLYQYIVDIENKKCQKSFALINTYKKQYKLSKIDEHKKMISWRNDIIAKAKISQAEIYQSLGKLDKAIILLEEAIKLSPKLYESYNNLGIIYFIQGKIDHAQKLYSKSVKLNPDFAQGYYNIGLCYLKDEDFQQARLYFKKAVEKDPEYEKAKSQMRLLEEKINATGNCDPDL
ncbi:MAG: tetratricopeptide repeat protein [Candidatus Omnitrophota bacterium]